MASQNRVPVMAAPKSNGSAPAAPVASSHAASAPPADPAAKRKWILTELCAGHITEEKADELLGEMESARPSSSLRCKVSAKGACSVYGLQRMPVTLYVEQWERLIQFVPELAAFLKEHNAQLKRKARE